MGSFIEINDTLQLSQEQWFPVELDYEKHQVLPFTAKDFQGKIFKFHDKPKIRLYQMPPVRNFLVQNIEGKWLYWWLVHIIEVTHDMVQQMTSWKFEIIHIYSPEEMESAHHFIDRNPETSFFPE